MNILVLEDNIERQKAFTKKFNENTLVFVETANDAIEKLKSQKWDCLFLDHDLGEETEDSNPGNGYEVAQWLANHAEHKPNEIIIHSANPVGSTRMKSELPEAKIVPFAWM
jgi:CheY-like chemotaxis protein